MSHAEGEPIGVGPSPGEYNVVVVKGSRSRLLRPFASWQGAVLALVIAVVAWRAASRDLLWAFVVVLVVALAAVIAVSQRAYSRQARRLAAGARVLCYVRREAPEETWDEIEPMLSSGALLVDMGEPGLYLCPNDGSSCSGGLALRRHGVGVTVCITAAGKAVEAILVRNGATRRVHASGRLPDAERRLGAR